MSKSGEILRMHHAAGVFLGIFLSLLASFQVSHTEAFAASDSMLEGCPATALGSAKVLLPMYANSFQTLSEKVMIVDPVAGISFQKIFQRFSTLQGTIEEVNVLVSEAGFHLLATADPATQLQVNPTAAFYAFYEVILAETLISSNGELPCKGFNAFYLRMNFLRKASAEQIEKFAISSQKLKQKNFERARILLSQVDKPVLSLGLHTDARCPSYSPSQGLSEAEAQELTSIDDLYEKEFQTDLRLCCGRDYSHSPFPDVPLKCSNQSLNPLEYQALLNFTLTCSGSLNYALFSGDALLSEKCDSVIYEFERALSHFPDFRGPVRRGANKDQSYLDTIQPGQDFIEKNFMSTSANPGWLWSGNVLLEIVSLHGKHIVLFSPYGIGENEVVMQPSSQFRVLSKKFDTTISRTVIGYQELKK